MRIFKWKKSDSNLYHTLFAKIISWNMLVRRIKTWFFPLIFFWHLKLNLVRVGLHILFEWYRIYKQIALDRKKWNRRLCTALFSNKIVFFLVLFFFLLKSILNHFIELKWYYFKIKHEKLIKMPNINKMSCPHNILIFYWSKSN